MPYEIAYTMHRGKAGLQQQDALLLAGTVIQNDDLPVTVATVTTDDLLLAVADGVAASPSARQASRIVLEELADAVRHYPEWCHDGFVTGRHLRRVQLRLCERFASSPRGFGASSTVATVHLRADRWCAINVGDSRVYLASPATGWHQVSKDHTVLQEMIERGEAQRGQAYARIYDALSHCLVADWEEEAFAIHQHGGALAADAFLLICSDGVHDTLGPDDWPFLARGEPCDLAGIVGALRKRVLAAGAPDNFSLLAVR